MKVISHEKREGAVTAYFKAVIEATPEEIEAFQKALGTVEAFKHLARKATGAKNQNADWTMYAFNILRRDGKVEVNIDQGMCG
jgi:hypothetical protein